ncbi:MAG: hypothetical protein Q8K75_10415 [Chlamydiales bacterium]|nr:hypothetical protein [Chlamydiales bacterium]
MSTTQNWKELSSIYVGCTVCLPVIIIGQELCLHYGMLAAVASIFLGNAVLFCLGWVATLIGAKERRSTPEQAQKIFGTVGGRLFAATMICSMIVWFAIQLNVMCDSAQEALGVPAIVLNILFGLAITLCARKGIGALSRMAAMCAPLLAVTIIWALVQAPIPSMPTVTEWPGLRGVSLVMATAIAMVIDIPTYFRYARTTMDGIITNALVFLVALPLVEGIGVYLSAGMTEGTILQALQGSGGTIWCIWIALFLLIAGWASNNTNLFSAVISAEVLAPTISHDKRTLALGAFGTLLACLNVGQHVEQVVTVLGIGVSSMGGAMIAAYLLNSTATMRNLFSWSLGYGVGLLAFFQIITLSDIALLDAFVCSGLTVAALQIVCKKDLELANEI